MKQLMMCLSFLLSALQFGLAQSAPGIYAYSQEIIPGTRAARTIDENGRITETAPATSTHYLLYLTANSPAAFSVTAVWLNGSAYTATLQKVSLPVILSSPAPLGKQIEDTLVGREHRNAWQLALNKSNHTLMATRAVKKAMARNELVIAWQGGGKKGLTCAKTIKKLPAVALQ